MKKTEQRTSDEQIAFITSEILDDPNFADFMERLIKARKGIKPFASTSLKSGIDWLSVWIKHCGALRDLTGSASAAGVKGAANECYLRMIADFGIFFQVTKEIGDARHDANGTEGGDS